eukprot:gene19578-22261_t
MSAVDPVAWANKRKAAIENAKKLREARKNGEQEDTPSFTPQVNKRPSYLKQTDSLDKLANAINIDPSDIFEQPLPGARPAQSVQNDYTKQNLPSPGSDALGREVKRHGPAGDVKSSQPVYKSKFLQQYEQENSQEDDYQPPARQNAQVPSRSNPPAQSRGYEYQSPVKAEEPDEPFMNSLRGAGGSSGKKGSTGPGWNDDTTSGGFAPAPVRKGVAAKGRAGARVDYDQEETPAPRVPVGGRRAAPQARAPAQDWNMDTEVSYVPPPALPPKVSPRLPAQQQRRTDSDGAATQARPNLSLLKSKIRRSESGKNVLAMETSNSTASGFGGQDYDNSTAEKVADIRNGGRRSAPNQRVMDAQKASAGRMSRTTQGQRYEEEERDEEPAYVPSQAAGRARPAPVQSKPAQRPAFNAQYDEEDDPYGPDAYPPGGYPSAQRAKPAPVAQKKTTSYSRWDDDPYGPDAYPPGGYPPAAAQPSKPKAAPAAQPRRAADSRFDADPDPYGPDAYSPGGYPPARSQPAAQTKSKAPPAQARRAAPQPSYVPDDDPYGPDAYPPGGYPPPAAAAPTEYPEESGEMRECPHCGRKFNVTPYAKHIKICEKVFIKKRKVFDSTKMRIQGVDPELEKILAQAAKDAAKQAAIDKRNAAKGGQNQAVPVKQKAQAAVASGGGGGGGGGGDAAGKWKEQSNAFREAMKAARQYSKAVAEGKPLPPPVASAPDASLIPCPTCGRRFNAKAAERHIPQCKNIIAKPTMLKRGGGGGGGVNGTAAVQAGGLGSTKGKGRF